MSSYQCEQCGCLENTAYGNYHIRNDEKRCPESDLNRALCTACMSPTYRDGTPNPRGGKWHNRFARIYLPKGMFRAHFSGKLLHKETRRPYTEYASDKEYV